MGRVGNNSGTHPPCYRDIWPYKTSETLIFLRFFQYWGGQRKVNDLSTSPNNKLRDYFIWNRIEKLVPLNWKLSPQTLKTAKKNRPTRFQTLTFWWNLCFQKSNYHGSFFHGFSMEAAQTLQRTGNPSVFIVGHPSMNNNGYPSIFIDGPSMNSLMVHQWIWSPSFGPLSLGPSLGSMGPGSLGRAL